MMNTLALIYVAFGGAFGSLMRYSAIGLVSRLNPTEFPLGTLMVNIVGSFLMGVWIATMTVIPTAKAKDLHLLFAVGTLGGFTTFSAFSFDMFQLLEREMYGQMAIYIAASVICSLAALLAGVWLVKLVAA